MKTTGILLTAFLLAGPLASAQGVPSVNYEQFGAVGDGVHDDMPAIVAAHDYANERGLPVKLSSGRTYYIGGHDLTAVIKTDTDWGEANFIIDDRALENIRQDIFVVEPSQGPFDVEGVETLARGQSGLGITLPCDCLVEVEDSNDKVYIREGLNQNNGKAKVEVLVALRDGTVREDSGIIWDFDNITGIRAYPMDAERLVVRGGVFTTIANQAESKYKYHGRGIVIRRSNVLVEGIEHYVTGETDHGAPYSSFVGTEHAADVIIRECLFTAHKTYGTIGSAGKPVKMGSYDLQTVKSVNVLIRDCSQTTDIDDTGYWGLFASNYCKALSMERCRFSRFDAHQGVRGVSLKGCTFGHQGVRMVGFGTLLVEDCEVRAKEFIHFRSDYGSSWDGDVVIRNCRFVVKGNKRIVPVISGANSGLHDFGYRCRLPERILIENLHIDDSAVADGSYGGPVIFGDFKRSPEAVYPYPAEGEITVRGVTADSGKPLRLAEDPAPFGAYRVHLN